MPSRRMLVRVVIATCSLLLLSSATGRAQRFATEELQTRGTTAYNTLPANVTLIDAPKFSEALGYLYAYAQRMERAKQTTTTETQVALDWMLRNIANMSAGKADGFFRSDEVLHDRGMAMYRKAAASETQGLIWDVPAYLSAATNLFAYLQVAAHPSSDAKSAHAWLVQAEGRLVKSGGKGDNPSEGWLPRGSRPGAAKRPVGGVAVRKAARKHGATTAASKAGSKIH